MTIENNEIAKIFAERIKNKFDLAFSYCFISSTTTSFDSVKFELVKELASLVSELLDRKELKNKLIELANTSQVNGEDNEIKLDTYDLIRNIIIHFPIFDSWDEIYISNELLSWNKPYHGQIKKYFDKNKGKKFTYRIYLNENGKWVEKHKIIVNIPELKDGEKIYLKDILSLDNAIWTFAIIDYYLKDLGLNIEPYRFIASL